MNQPTDPSEASIRYGLTPLGRKVLSDAAVNEPVTEPLRRLRRTRTRVRMLVRVTRRG